MFNILDELRLGMAAKAEQDRLIRETAERRLLRDVRLSRPGRHKEWLPLAQFFSLFLKAMGTNGQMNWKP
jgi:hypothetical protein